MPVSPEVSEILRRIARYVKIAFASVKPVYYLEGLARGIGVHDIPLIGENGAVIYLPEKNEEFVFDDVNLAAKNELSILRDELYKRLYNKCWFQPNRVIVTAFPKGNFTIQETKKEFKDVIRNHGLKNIKLHVNIDSVECIPEGVDKGWGINQLQNILNIPECEITAVGNSDNDIPMFIKADLSICVGNKQNIKEIANKTFETGIEALKFIAFSSIDDFTRK